MHKIITCFALLLITAVNAPGENLTTGENLITGQNQIKWITSESGLETATASPEPGKGVIHSPIFLVRYNPEHLATTVVMASDFGNETSQVEDIKLPAAEDKQPLLLINASFFTPELTPLGLIVRSGKQLNPSHKGGNLLSGLLLQKKRSKLEVQRFNSAALPNPLPELAIQAGPRLIVDGVASKIRAEERMSRRSGLALTDDGKAIIFITKNGLPGISFRQLQAFLLRPELKIRQALNFDGGSSSQLRLFGAAENGTDMVISGGDAVPVFLAVEKILTKQTPVKKK
ncbi:MAG: phosphodiester glycosidase family protein [bacterium]|nr:phosphodiester glycosidase family protein [bacterium]